MRKLDVSPSRQRLIELMQEVHFGTIEHLQIRDGDPVFDPSPVIIRDVALGKSNGQHPARYLANFELKDEVHELLALFDREKNVSIDRLVVQAGLPLRLRIKVGGPA